DGSYRWAKVMSVNGTGFGITTDPTTGNVIATGNCAGSADFGGGPVDAASSYCTFLSAFDASGKYLWAKGFDGGCGWAAVAVDANGYLALTGETTSTMSLGDNLLPAWGNPTYFVASFTVSGGLPPACRWAKNGSGGSSWGTGVAFDTSGNL